MANRWDDDDVLETARKRDYVTLEVQHGMTLTHTGSRFTGRVAGFSEGDRVVLVDDMGRRETFRAFDGAFVHDGTRVALRVASPSAEKPIRVTASGSVHVGESRARIAKVSRVWVEGVHDAELIEKIWGYDLREAATVVEPMHGVDRLPAAVADFQPGPGRRLGILLDHLVEGSKESALARAVQNPNVLVTGHPYVDIWQAIRPQVAGIAAWPIVPPGRPWKEGVLTALGVGGHAGGFWAKVLDSVSSYRDVETPLVNAVERLIDFVTVEE